MKDEPPLKKAKAIPSADKVMTTVLQYVCRIPWTIEVDLPLKLSKDESAQQRAGGGNSIRNKRK